MMFIKVFRMSTGESIIASVVEETKEYVDLYRPIKLYFSPRGETSVGVMMAKWDYIVNFEHPTRVFKNSIVSVAEPTENFKDSYVEFYNQYDSSEEEDDDNEEEDDTSSNLSKVIDLLKVLGPKANTTFH
jgi:hypothetical protein